LAIVPGSRIVARSTTQLPQFAFFNIEVKGTATPSRVVKLVFNPGAVSANPILTNGGSVTPAGICTVNPNTPFTYTCEPGMSGSFVVKVRVRSDATAHSVELSSIVSTTFGRDCAVAFESIQISNPAAPAGGCVSLTTSGTFCYDEVSHCFKLSNCQTTRKRASPGVRRIFPMTYAISYRRIRDDTRSLRNSHETSCGPRFSFLVDGVPQYLSTQSEFLSQGRLSFFGNASLPFPSVFKVDFVTTAYGCDHSKLLVFNEDALITDQELDTVFEEPPVNRFADVKF